MEKVTVGIDIGGTSFKLGIVNEQGTIIHHFSYPVRRKLTQEEMIEQLGENVLALLREAGITKDQVKGIGVGCPGSINSQQGICDYSNNLPWHHLPVTDILQKICHLPCRMTNDANAATLGEVKYGCGRGYQNVIMLTLGTGVGGGVIINGELYEGHEGKGAELGHCVIRFNGRQCTCGRKGCLEAYASASSLMRATKKAMVSDVTSELWTACNHSINRMTGKLLFDCAKNGDPLANRILDQYFIYLKEGILNYCNIFRPELIIIGGGLSNQKDYFLARLVPLLKEEHYGFLHTPIVEIKCAELGNEAGIIGAAALFDEP